MNFAQSLPIGFLILCTILVACSDPISFETPRNRIDSEEEADGTAEPVTPLTVDITFNRNGVIGDPWLYNFVDPVDVKIDTSVSPPVVWINRLFCRQNNIPEQELLELHLRADAITADDSQVFLEGDPDLQSGVRFKVLKQQAGVILPMDVFADNSNNFVSLSLSKLPAERTITGIVNIILNGVPANGSVLSMRGTIRITY